MNKLIYFLVLPLCLVSVTAVSVFANDVFPEKREKLIFSNFNDDPVQNNPPSHVTLSIPDTKGPVLITRIHTKHWNNGNGATPGVIALYEIDDNVEICRGNGNQGSNKEWITWTDCFMHPGHRYTIKVSDSSSWSYNKGSENAGMFEVYGVWPIDRDGVPPYSALYPVAPSSSKGISVGSIVRLGTYEQDNNPRDGEEPIEWIVLSIQGDRMLVISRYILDVVLLNDELMHTGPWEKSWYRDWLNRSFYWDHFTDDERNQILTVINQNPDNPMFGLPGGKDTEDNIFLLSYAEVIAYFKSGADRMAAMTDFAHARSGFIFGNPKTYLSDTCPWTLRTSGNYFEGSLMVAMGDHFTYTGMSHALNHSYSYYGIRPALWMKIPSKPAPAPTPTSAPRNCFTVTYEGADCLTKVPTDSRCYQAGNTVTVLFEPVEYIQNKIFNGWDRDGDGVADHGYYYNTFVMPAKDVTLKAVCYQQYQDPYHNQYYGVTTNEVDPDYTYTYRNTHDNYVPGATYDPGTGWWYSSDYYYDGDGEIRT